MARTIALCIEKGYLAKYLGAHRVEVEKIMITMLSPEYIKKASERTQKIKELIIRRYDLTPTYAQNFLDDDTDPEDCRPWAI